MRLVFLFVIVLTSAFSPAELPDLSLTPGEVNLSCTMDDICPHLDFRRPSVSSALRNKIYNRYGMQKYCSQKFANGNSVCEVDHLISVELCGATTVENLWPESYMIKRGAHTKDRLENRLHKLVCSGEMSLEDAQQAEVTNWFDAFEKYVK